MKARDCFLSVPSTRLKEQCMCGVWIEIRFRDTRVCSCVALNGVQLVPTDIAWLIGIIHSGVKSEACSDAGVLFQQALFRHLSIKCHERLQADKSLSLRIRIRFSASALSAWFVYFLFLSTFDLFSSLLSALSADLNCVHRYKSVIE